MAQADAYLGAVQVGSEALGEFQLDSEGIFREIKEAEAQHTKRGRPAIAGWSDDDDEDDWAIETAYAAQRSVTGVANVGGHAGGSGASSMGSGGRQGTGKPAPPKMPKTQMGGASTLDAYRFNGGIRGRQQQQQQQQQWQQGEPADGQARRLPASLAGLGTAQQPPQHPQQHQHQHPPPSQPYLAAGPFGNPTGVSYSRATAPALMPPGTQHQPLMQRLQQQQQQQQQQQPGGGWEEGGAGGPGPHPKPTTQPEWRTKKGGSGGGSKKGVPPPPAEQQQQWGVGGGVQSHRITDVTNAFGGYSAGPQLQLKRR